jgi:hypothetical protein
MKGWYYAAAEKAGVKEPGESLDKYCGRWQEKDGGSGTMEITQTFAPGKLKIDMIPLDIDVTPMDNSGTQKEGVSWTYKKFEGYSPIMAYLV